ncbi:MAG: hypothetical protein JWM32_2013 [Verrucomicrobia bacterium]|nr:hypothetical protein [Verrucomicrobiota bacterium]
MPRSFFPMLERFIQAISVADPGAEEPAATRERLKDKFPRGATRRMTQLGMLVGAALDELAPRSDDAVVYASSYAESRALEAYLESFPTASPTMFQTSIHPSAVQQAMIGRQHPVREFFPLTGRAHLVAQAMQAAMLSPAPRVLVCGGEERGTWLLAQGYASARSFAFALALTSGPGEAIGKIALARSADQPAALPLETFFAALAARQPLDLVAAPGMRLNLAWL